MLKLVRGRLCNVHRYRASSGADATRPIAGLVLDKRGTDSAPGPRHLSTQERTSEPPLLKRVLRELYKRVHPDLFHDVPHAREANEQSFKLLQVHGHFGQLPMTCSIALMPMNARCAHHAGLACLVSSP